MSKTEPTRPEFLYEIKDIMKEHSLTEKQAVQILTLLHGIEWELPATDALVLYNKRLLKVGNKVNLKVLFRHQEEKVKQVIEKNFNSTAIGTDKTLKLAKNLEEEFVPDTWVIDEHLKSVADEFFAGDLTLARYFMTFKALFPVRDLKLNKKWNKHFKITYEDTSRWSSSYLVPKKFGIIYKTKDIGLLLSGLYFAVKDSINFMTHQCYMQKPERFLNGYTQWYELASNKLNQVKLKSKSTKSL